MKLFTRGSFRVKPPKGVDTTHVKPASAPPSNSNADPDCVYPSPLPDGLTWDSESWEPVAIEEPKSPTPSPSEGLLKAAVGDGLDHDEKLKLAQKEVDQAESLIRIKQQDIDEYKKLLILRRDNLERIKKS